MPILTSAHLNEVSQAPLPEKVQHVLQSSGQPLNETTRRDMEGRFGHDFRRVRIHADGAAAESADGVAAEAYTVGPHIVFARDRFQPRTHSGERLLAHELTHVVQQAGSPASALLMRQEAPAPAQETPAKKAPPVHDYKRLAAQIYKAIAGPGTDEEAVYRALQELDRDDDAIIELERVYWEDYKIKLLDDINDDFGGEELEYALQLMNKGTPGAKQRVENLPGEPGKERTASVHDAAIRIREAVQGPGTDEEAIYSVLLPFRRNTLELENEYQRMYGEDLRDRLVDELEENSSELEYALDLLESPYERFIQEGNQRLAGAPFHPFGDFDTFCVAGEKNMSEGHELVYWYDREYWEPERDLQTRSCKVVLLDGKSAADAIDAMFDIRTAGTWRARSSYRSFTYMRCGYALRHTMGKARFDQQFNKGPFTLQLKRRQSTGVETAVIFERKTPSGAMVRSDTGQPDPRLVDDILASAPIGSRVRWTNLIGEGKEKFNEWQHENTIKLGPDKFGAHGTATGVFTKSNTHTRAEVELMTARGTNPDADSTYVKDNIFISEIEIFKDPSRESTSK